MVQTRSAANEIEPTHEVSELQQHQDDPALAVKKAPGPTKRRRQKPQANQLESASSSKTRRRGKPRELCQLNLDVLFLIAEYIHPLDLLNLSRTCKSLNTLLMDKSSTFVWKACRRPIRYLPDCPADLTEPEYANLAFYARCHHCGKYVKAVFWKMRRRYCPACRPQRLILPHDCDEIIRLFDCLPWEECTVKKKSGRWYDKDQVNSFMQEYGKASDKMKFLQEQKAQSLKIKWHADACERWEKGRIEIRRQDLKACRSGRDNNIFERLKQCGYEAEIRHHGHNAIRNSYPAVFGIPKPLTDKAWERMRPDWLKIMNNFRERRIAETVYYPRGRMLLKIYKNYVEHPPSDAPSIDILPNVVDLSSFPPLSAIIKAPEGVRVEDSCFASAFSQLPMLVHAWKQQVDGELVALIKIPSSVSADLTVLGDTEPEARMSLAGSPRTDFDKLRLACALFCVDKSGPHPYPDLLAFCQNWLYPDSYYGPGKEVTGTPIVDRWKISFLPEAATIIQTCGLNPSVATPDDMDRRNARLMCKTCVGKDIMTWRNAVWHAFERHHASYTSRARWQLVSDDHLEAIQLAERSVGGRPISHHIRCLLCRNRAAGAMSSFSIVDHLRDVHKLKVDKSLIEPGVHFMDLDIRYVNHAPIAEVRMVEDGENVTFEVSPQWMLDLRSPYVYSL